MVNKEINKYIKKWSTILKLNNYDINVLDNMKSEKMGNDPENLSSLADVYWFNDFKYIRIRLDENRKNDKSYISDELNILHELVHVIIGRLHDFIMNIIEEGHDTEDTYQDAIKSLFLSDIESIVNIISHVLYIMGKDITLKEFTDKYREIFIDGLESHKN